MIREAKNFACGYKASMSWSYKMGFLFWVNKLHSSDFLGESLKGNDVSIKIQTLLWASYQSTLLVKTSPSNLGTKIPRHAFCAKNQNIKQQQYCDKFKDFKKWST